MRNRGSEAEKEGSNMVQNAERAKCAVEIRFDEVGNVLKVEQYRISEME